jgi:hypothetical protein
MKKLIILAAALMLLPGALFSGEIVRDGDPCIYAGFVEATYQIMRGETYCTQFDVDNYPYDLCGDAEDTFCMHYTDDLGWAYTAPGHGDGVAFILSGGWGYHLYNLCITAACDATVGAFNTFTATMNYVDVYGECQPDSADCVDPNIYDPENIWYRTSTITFEVIDSPPALSIVQDSLFLIERGIVAAYVPFWLHNGDACVTSIYGYSITSTGVVGDAINVIDVIEVPGGEAGQVFGIIDASLGEVCDLDVLTIIAWDEDYYDTCVQVIHIIEPVAVPLFTTPVVTILVLAMILAAAVIMKRTAISKA